MAFVYGLRAADSTDYFYIGSTKHTLERRLKQHLDYIRLGYNKNLHLVRKVKLVGAENVVIDAFQECSEQEQFICEYEWIKLAVEHGWPLTNIVHEQPAFEMRRRVEEYENYELRPDHIDAIIEAFDCGVHRIGDGSLHDAFADVLEPTCVHIFEHRFNEFLEQIYQIMENANGEQNAERQAAGVYQRIFAMLERG